MIEDLTLNGKGTVFCSKRSGPFSQRATACENERWGGRSSLTSRHVPRQSSTPATFLLLAAYRCQFRSIIICITFIQRRGRAEDDKWAMGSEPPSFCLEKAP
jgi:hypothetical protein